MNVIGVAGDRLGIELKVKAQGARQQLRQMIYASCSAYLGVYGGETEITFLELRPYAGKWMIGRKAEEKWQRPADFDEMAGEFAEHVAMRLSREGWENLPLAICVPEKECICKVFPMSADIPVEEQKTAAFWEIDNYLQSCGLAMENVSCTSVRLPGDNMAVEAVIFLKEKIKLLEESLAGKGYEIAGLYPETPVLERVQRQETGWQIGRLQIGEVDELFDANGTEGERRALYAAFGLAGLGNFDWPENLLTKEKHEGSWNYAGLSRLVALLVAGVLVLFLCIDLGELYLSYQEAEEARGELAVMEPARLVMLEDREMTSVAEYKEACLGRLTEKSRPLDSLLIHLGSVTVEGAWLTEVDCTQERVMQLKGEAVDYSALGEFLAAFEKDRGFFTGVPILEESRQREGLVEFRLRMEMGI